VGRLDRQTVAATNATLPLLVGYGILAIGTVLASLICLWTGIGKGAARFALLVIAAVLIALLPARFAPRPPTLVEPELGDRFEVAA
jgi:hypothetical protein